MKKRITTKLLLLIENASVRPQALKFDDPDVEIVFLPPNFTILIQPLDQSIIATFKSYYAKIIFQFIFNLIELVPTLSLMNCKNFNILICVYIIK